MQRIRVLIADDFDEWRRFLRTHLELYPEFQIVGEACDGEDAIRKAKDLVPDLILLDIGLPKVNGLVAARVICTALPAMNILFVSVLESRIIMQEALQISPCARGYVWKLDAGRDLVPAMKAAVLGKA